MTYDPDCTLPEEFLEPIIEQGLEALPDMIQTLIDAAMQIERQRHLGASSMTNKQQWQLLDEIVAETRSVEQGRLDADLRQEI